MDAIANWVWQGCLVALVAILMLRLLDRSGAHVRYVVCGAALAAVLLLPFMSAFAALALPPIVEPSAPVLSVPHAWWTSGVAVAAAWAVWSAASAVRVLLALPALRRAKRRCRTFPSALEARLPQWQRVRGDGRIARLRLSCDVRTASVLGGASPVIAVSPRLVQDLGPDEIDRVVIHEWAHVQRRDDLLLGIQLAARVVAGWHPAVWWLDRRLDIEREMACDEIVVAITGSRKRYAACLAKLASLPEAAISPLPAPGALSSPALAQRIVRILTPAAFASRAWTRAAGAACLVSLGILTANVGAFRLVDVAAFPVLPYAALVSDAAARARSADTPVSARAPVPDAGNRPADPHRSGRDIAARPPSAGRRPGGAIADRAAQQQVEDAPETRRAAPVLSSRTTLSSSPILSTVQAAPAVSYEATAPGPVVTSSDDRADREATAVQPSDPGSSPVRAWSAAATMGVAAAERSKRAGVATAGFFNRLGNRIAGSF